MEKFVISMFVTYADRYISMELPKYYLVTYDESNDVEVFLHEVIMDVAFANDFGF